MKGVMKWWVWETRFYENYLFFTFLLSVVSVNLILFVNKIAV